MSSKNPIQTRELADEITEFVKRGAEKPVYTATVIDCFAGKNVNRTDVKITLWDLIVGKQILVNDKYELSVVE